ncbi:g9775 [Coccomyxa elongata]
MRRGIRSINNEGPTSLLGWNLCFKDPQVEADFLRGQDVASKILDSTWSMFLAVAGIIATRRDFDKFSRNTVYLNTVSSLVPTVLLLLCPGWYIANRRWLLAFIKAKHLTLTPWHGRVFPRLDTPWAVFFSVVISSRTWLQLGDCLFWNTGLHMEVLTNCLWLVLTVLRTPVYCKRSSLAAIEDEPVLKHLDLLLSKTGTDALAGVSGHIAARPLHDANVCNLTMAFLTVVLGCILPINLIFYFERMLRIQHAKRVMASRGMSVEAGGLVDDRCYAFMTVLGLSVGLSIALWQVIEFLDFLFPQGVYPPDIPRI